MKFLAILEDSLREAIDAKVFYVMIGLSLLLILVSSTMTFTPKPGGKMVMQMAALPLSFDTTDLKQEELGKHRNPIQLMQRLRGSYQVADVQPVANAEDLPGSDFVVTVRSVETGFGFFFSRPSPEKVMAQIRERFGVFDDMRIAEVLDVEHRKGDYLVTTRLTLAGKRLWPHDFSLFFGSVPVSQQGVPLGMQVYVVENVLVNQIGSWVTILVSVVLTSFYIPNMLRKGTVDLLVVKPIHRVNLLLYKYIGGLIFIFINTTVAVGGVWLALTWRSGIYGTGFLVSIPAITFFFAILYSVSALFGVLTRSPIVCILVTCFVWFVLFVVGAANTLVDVFGQAARIQAQRNAAVVATVQLGLLSQGASPLNTVALLPGQEKYTPYDYKEGWFPPVIRTVHMVLPRTSDLNTLMEAQLQRDLLPRSLTEQALSSRQISWGESLGVSGLFIAVMLGLACWRFAVKDY